MIMIIRPKIRNHKSSVVCGNAEKIGISNGQNNVIRDFLKFKMQKKVSF
ncbi:hypothetical protein QIA27_05535 (plasmid) [Borreliella tanukii]